MKNNTIWMAISGVLAIVFFLIANFTDLFLGLNLAAGLLQVALNILVFTIWIQGFSSSLGFKKFVSFFGVVIPPVMAGITIYRVFIPAIFG